MMNSSLLISSPHISALDVNQIFDQKHTVLYAETTRDALDLIAEKRFSLLIMNASPTSSPMAVSDCKSLRMASPQSALIVTAFDPPIEFQEEILEAGADDFVEMPCPVSKLKTRIESALRLVTHDSRSVLRAGDLELDAAAGTVRKGPREIHLFPMEFKLLEFFMNHPNQVFTSNALWQRVWHGHGSSADTVRTHIKTLRKKIDTPQVPSLIKTEYRGGYKLIS